MKKKRRKRKKKTHAQTLTEKLADKMIEGMSRKGSKQATLGRPGAMSTASTTSTVSLSISEPGMLEIEFTKRPFGFSLVKNKKNERLFEVKNVSEPSIGDKGLEAGMLLQSVSGTDVTGANFDMNMLFDLLTKAQLPCKILFIPQNMDERLSLLGSKRNLLEGQRAASPSPSPLPPPPPFLDSQKPNSGKSQSAKFTPPTIPPSATKTIGKPVHKVSQSLPNPAANSRPSTDVDESAVASTTAEESLPFSDSDSQSRLSLCEITERLVAASQESNAERESRVNAMLESAKQEMMAEKKKRHKKSADIDELSKRFFLQGRSGKRLGATSPKDAKEEKDGGGSLSPHVQTEQVASPKHIKPPENYNPKRTGPRKSRIANRTRNPPAPRKPSPNPRSRPKVAPPKPKPPPFRASLTAPPPPKKKSPSTSPESPGKKATQVSKTAALSAPPPDSTDEAKKAEAASAKEEEDVADPSSLPHLSLPVVQNPSDDWSKNCKKRIPIIKEIVSSEKSYVASLGKLFDNFFNPLFNKKILDPSLKPAITTNAQPIYNFHKDFFLGALEKADNIPQVFVRNGAFLKMYTAYVDRCDDVRKKIMKLQGSNKKFAKFLSQPGQDPATFLNYLIQPVQRVPRYRLLLEDLQKRTQKNHPQYNDLEKALQNIKEISTHINESKRNIENLEEMMKLSKNLGSKGNQLWKAARKLLRKGQLLTESANWKNGTLKAVNAFMFNDALLLCTDSIKFRQEFLFEHVTSITDINCKSSKDKSDFYGVQLEINGLAAPLKLYSKKENVILEWRKLLHQHIETSMRGKVPSRDRMISYF